MNLNHFLILVAKLCLFLLEYLFKLSAGIVSIIVLGSQGSFIVKLGTGFGSLVNVYNQLLKWPDKLAYLGNVIHDYNTLTASAFNQRYGGQALNRTMESLNEGVLYGQSVYQNLTNQPFTTITATFIAFFVLYFLARTFRFIRQRGQGSYLVRKERELGRQVFQKAGDKPQDLA